MEATQAVAIGHHGTVSTPKSTRLGNDSAEAQANTNKTFATVIMRKNGSGYLKVKRNGELIVCETWGKE